MNFFYGKKIMYHARRLGIDFISSVSKNEWPLKDRPGKRIVLYHGVDRIGQTYINGRFVSADVFERQLDFFKSNYNLVSLSDLISGKTDPNRMNIAIVFDDGYRNNLETALPILEKKQIHATFFVTAINDTSYPMLWADYLDLASYVNTSEIVVGEIDFKKQNGIYKNAFGMSLKDICKTKDWAFKSQLYSAFPKGNDFIQEEKWEVYWKTLSDEEIITLDKSDYATVELHGYYHENLGVCNHTEAVQLVRKSKKYLENLLQREIQSIAYPDGSYTKDLIQSCFQMGLKNQFAVDFLFPEDEIDSRIHSRLTINPFTNISHQVWAVLNNRY